MKPQTNISVIRTQNDTDVVSFQLQITTDDGTTYVPSSATVVMRVKTAAGISELPGVYRSGSEGVFVFDVASVSTTAGTLSFEIRVTTFEGVVYTIGKGTMKVAPTIG